MRADLGCPRMAIYIWTHTERNGLPIVGKRHPLQLYSGIIPIVYQSISDLIIYYLYLKLYKNKGLALT
jgi:hypothetical protein